MRFSLEFDEEEYSALKDALDLPLPDDEMEMLWENNAPLASAFEKIVEADTEAHNEE